MISQTRSSRTNLEDWFPRSCGTHYVHCASGFIDRSGNCSQPYDIHQLPGLQLRRPVPSSGINRPLGSGSDHCGLSNVIGRK
ncbi:hypothetical protein QLX08_006388 [Tetragonisca angustula]|uniref:Uncharacterized protein n=1 Tax=Tetragonisca angustula TaxID=166442 RepID=A0AAW0ZUA4_9HYME